jgi:ferredoxin
MKVTVDWSLCDGNGVCSTESPEVFEIDDEDNLILLQQEIGDALIPSVEKAVARCPKRAISLES